MRLNPRHCSTVLLPAVLALLVLALAPGQPVGAAPSLPPRPTPIVTPSPTPAPTPTPRPVSRDHAAPAPDPVSHILLATTPALDGLWTVVQWQGQDGVWHEVAGWQGSLVSGAKRWAVQERNFGEGPFRWVVYDAPGGQERGASQPFSLPAGSGVQLQIRVAIES